MAEWMPFCLQTIPIRSFVSPLDCIAFDMETSSSIQPEDVPILEEPELADMTWSSFAVRFKERCGQKIMSFLCYHTGKTTTVVKSTIRTTLETSEDVNRALIMEADTGEYFVAISKAQGCDETKVLDPSFIGWVRRYEGPFFGERWIDIDNDVNNFLQDNSGEEGDDEPDNPDGELDDETFKSRLWWRELVMRARQNDKGEWSYVYVTQIDGVEYTLLNKGARFLQTGLLETWNPPRSKSVQSRHHLRSNHDLERSRVPILF